MADADISPSTSQAVMSQRVAGLCRRLLIRAAALSPAAVAIPATATIIQLRPR